MRKNQETRQKNYSARRSSTKYIALVVAMLLAVGGVVSGTVAWLIDQTDTVENTFTYGDIDITLTETKTDEKGNPEYEGESTTPKTTTEGNTYKMLPGEIYLKDPKVTVLKNSEVCWLFVKLEKSGGVEVDNGDGTTTKYTFDDYLEFSVAEGWEQLQDETGSAVEGVYYRKVPVSAENQTFGVIGYNQPNGESEPIFVPNMIKVRDTVTKEMLNALDNNGANKENATYPKLSVTAYAVQHSGFEPAVDVETGTSSPEQISAAALKAWNAMKVQNAPNIPAEP